MEQMTEKWRQDRKFYTILPLLIIPFLTLGFWSLGGGKGIYEAETVRIANEFNTEMPGVGNDPLMENGKMAYYESARRDSMKMAEQIKNDPYRQLAFKIADQVTDLDETKAATPIVTGREKGNQFLTNADFGEMDPNEALVMEKLNQLNVLLDKKDTPLIHEPTQTFKPEPHTLGADLDRLEGMMRIMSHNPHDEDREMQELKGILENILDIQHPERVSQRLKEKNESEVMPVLPVIKETGQDVFAGLKTGQSNSKIPYESHTFNGFYSIEENIDEGNTGNSIQAVVHETQTLTTGATVKLRILESIRIGALTVPKDHFLFGIATLSGDRLILNIQNIRVGESIVPVALQLFDTDGLEGIYIPGAISRDAAKQAGDRGIQGMGMSAFNMGIGAQAASAGIETAKNLLSKKIKLIRVTVKAGYKVWLQDGSTKSQKTAELL